ncbi:MAG: hypothetical protein HY720_18175 [Planctomycetes bacterium]|nr:hypothetical protein [Planctomycetota bacterium]
MAFSAPLARGENILTSSNITSHFIENMVTPAEVITALDIAGVDFVLAGAYASNVWTGAPRATTDVDVVVASRHHRRAVAALRKAFPRLDVVDQQVVTRFQDPGSGRVFVDAMKPKDPITRAVFTHHVVASVAGHDVRIPDLEMALAMKFAAMIGIWREIEKKYMDAGDFISIVKANRKLDLEKLAFLGELAYSGGGREIRSLVEDARAGRRLKF